MDGRIIGMAGVMLSFLLAVMLVCVVLTVVVYVLQSLALYTIAKRRGIEHAWMAWVPFVCNYMLGKIADEYNERVEHRATYFRWVLVILSAAAFLLAYATGGAAPLGLLMSVVMLVTMFMTLYKIYQSTTDNYVVLLVLSIIFMVIVPFVLFAVRNGERPKPAGDQLPPPHVRAEGE